MVFYAKRYTTRYHIRNVKYRPEMYPKPVYLHIDVCGTYIQRGRERAFSIQTYLRFHVPRE